MTPVYGGVRVGIMSERSQRYEFAKRYRGHGRRVLSQGPVAVFYQGRPFLARRSA